MQSTRLCEEFNAYLGQLLRSFIKLFELVYINRALARITYNKAKAEYDSNHEEHVTESALASIAKYVATIYTRHVFEQF